MTRDLDENPPDLTKLVTIAIFDSTKRLFLPIILKKRKLPRLSSFFSDFLASLFHFSYIQNHLHSQLILYSLQKIFKARPIPAL